MSEEPDEYRRLALSWNAAAADYAAVFDSLEAALLPVAPDLMIVPQVLGPAIDLAWERALPLIIHAAHLPAAAPRRSALRPLRGAIAGYVAQLRARRRLEVARRARTRYPSTAELFRRSTVVATTHPSIEADPRVPPNFHLVGPVIPEPLSPISRETEEWLLRQAPAGIVLAAFGTLVRLSERQVSALAEGLADCGVGVLWAVPERHHDRVRRHSASFRAEAFVPQAAILALAAVRAFVTHAGANSALEAMRFGRPMLALPFMYDQHHYARRAADLSVGLVLDPHTLTSAGVRAAIQRLLHERRFAEAAGRLATELQRAPGVTGAAGVVEATLAGLRAR